jgi:hypothetical protein
MERERERGVGGVQNEGRQERRRRYTYMTRCGKRKGLNISY